MVHFPTEILADIFKYRVKTSRASRIQSGQILRLVHLPPNEFNPPLYVDAPSAIAGTCKHWRDVALGIPELWNVLEVINGVIYDVERYKLWLERAGADALFDVCFHFSDPGKPLFVWETKDSPDLKLSDVKSRARKLADLLELVETHSDKVRKLIVAMHYSLMTPPDADPFDLLTFPLPNVVSRRIYRCRLEEELLDLLVLKKDQVYPNMTQLEMVDVGAPWCSLGHIVQHSKQLETLFLDLSEFGMYNANGALHLTSLSSLSIRVRRTYDTPNISAFSTPNLKQLKLEFWEDEDGTPNCMLDMMEDILQNPKNLNLRRLEHLSLTGINPEYQDSEPIDEQIWAVYAVMEELKILDLCVDRELLEPEFLDCLSKPPLDETDSTSMRLCLPKLEELRLWSSKRHFPAKKWRSIQRVVQIRKREGAPLELLCVTDPIVLGRGGRAQTEQLFAEVAKDVKIQTWDGGYLIPLDHPCGGPPRYSRENASEFEPHFELEGTDSEESDTDSVDTERD